MTFRRRLFDEQPVKLWDVMPANDNPVPWGDSHRDEVRRREVARLFDELADRYDRANGASWGFR